MREWDATRGEADRRAALWLVNVAREAAGLPRLSSLRAGVTGASDRCAIAVSLDEIGAADVNDDRIYLEPVAETWDVLREVVAAVNATVHDRYGPMPYSASFEVPLPAPVKRFIIDFDDQRHPDLDAELQEARRARGYSALGERYRSHD